MSNWERRLGTGIGNDATQIIWRGKSGRHLFIHFNPFPFLQQNYIAENACSCWTGAHRRPAEQGHECPAAAGVQSVPGKLSFYYPDLGSVDHWRHCFLCAYEIYGGFSFFLCCWCSFRYPLLGSLYKAVESHNSRQSCAFGPSLTYPVFVPLCRAQSLMPVAPPRESRTGATATTTEDIDQARLNFSNAVLQTCWILTFF